MSEIEQRVKAIIVDKLGVDEAEVKPEASYKRPWCRLSGHCRTHHGI